MLNYDSERTERVYPSGNYSDPNSFKDEPLPVDGRTERGTTLKIRTSKTDYMPWQVTLGRNIFNVNQDDAAALYLALGMIFAGDVINAKSTT